MSSALSGPPAILPDIAVVIVTYNSAHVIGDLLDSLPRALDGLTADVVVVDNGSSDGTAERVAALGGCRLVRSANVGYAGGINRGVREAAPAQAILVLNPDLRLHPGSLPPLLAALREPRVGIAAPRVLTAQGDLHLSLRREPTLPRALGLTRTRLAVFSEYVYDPSAYTRPGTVDWALGAALLMSRECYEALVFYSFYLFFILSLLLFLFFPSLLLDFSSEMLGGWHARTSGRPGSCTCGGCWDGQRSRWCRWRGGSGWTISGCSSSSRPRPGITPPCGGTWRGGSPPPAGGGARGR